MNILGYEVKRKNVKNINCRLKSDGSICISAPLYLPEEHIKNFIISKKHILDRHVKQFERYKDLTKNLDTYTDNSYILFLGKKYTLKLIQDTNTNILINEDVIKITNDNITPDTIKKIVYNKLYYPKAKKLFFERLKYFLALTDEKNDVILRINAIKGKWGVCFPQKREIYLNIDLMKKSQKEIDSVVIHEVAHLKYPNHSKNFYNYIDMFFKDYKQINKKLNTLF